MTYITTTVKLNQLSFPSTDAAATAAFFERHLGSTVTALGDNRLPKRPGFDIVIETASDHAVVLPRTFHLGFESTTVQEVRDLHDRFEADAVEMETDVISQTCGSRFFRRAPGGVMIEINTRSDAAEPHRGSFS